MADGVFVVEVLTPERRLVEGVARGIVLRSSEGDLTVLDGHTPLITDIVPGEVRVDRPEGDPLRLAVHGGYLQVGSDDDVDGRPEGEGASPAGGSRTTTRVTVLAGVAELADEIDVARAEQARAQAAAQVEQLRAVVSSAPSGSGEADASPNAAARQLAQAEAALQRAEVRLSVAGVGDR